MKTVNKVYKVRKFESKKLDEVWEFDKSGEKKELLKKRNLRAGGVRYQWRRWICC